MGSHLTLILSDESQEERHARFARIRRTKWLLRFAPRRAALHRYPLIGRFADFARQRSYLWSFRTEHVRPALYAGSIVAFLPIMGVQIPVAFLLSLLLRTNFMVFAGLQFITNPFTAAPIYIGTYQLGQTIIQASGFGHSVEVVEDELDPAAPDFEPEPAPEREPQEPTSAPTKIAWTQRFGTTINALVLGGVVLGTVCGLILDLVWRWSMRPRPLRRRHPVGSDSTGRSPPPI